MCRIVRDMTSTQTTTTAAALLAETDNLDLATLTAAEWREWKEAAAKRRVRVWEVTGHLDRTVVVRTEGGTKKEAKKRARLAGLRATGSLAGSTTEAANWTAEGLAKAARRTALTA